MLLPLVVVALQQLRLALELRARGLWLVCKQCLVLVAPLLQVPSQRCPPLAPRLVLPMVVLPLALPPPPPPHQLAAQALVLPLQATLAAATARAAPVAAAAAPAPAAPSIPCLAPLLWQKLLPL